MLQSSLWGRAEAGHLPEATRCLVPFFLPSLPFSHPLTSFSWEHFFLGKSFAQERNLHLKVSFQATPSETALFFLNSLNKYEHCHSATMTPPTPTNPPGKSCLVLSGKCLIGLRSLHSEAQWTADTQIQSPH